MSDKQHCHVYELYTSTNSLLIHYTEDNNVKKLRCTKTTMLKN